MRWLFGLAALAATALLIWLAVSLVGLVFGPKSSGGGVNLWGLMAPLALALVFLLGLRLRMARNKRRKQDEHDVS